MPFSKFLSSVVLSLTLFISLVSGQNVSIVGLGLSPHSAKPGETIQFTFRLKSSESSSVKIGLGASLVSGGSEYTDESQDKVIVIDAGETKYFTRKFKLPSDISTGACDVYWAIWSVDGSNNFKTQLGVHKEDGYFEVLSPEPPSAEITVLEADGDPIVVSELNSLELWKGSSFIKKITPSSHVNTFNNLDKNSDYRVDAYGNDMSIGSASFKTGESGVSQKQINAPKYGELKVKVFYSDGVSPVKGITVKLYSHEDRVWREGASLGDGMVQWGSSDRAYVFPNSLGGEKWILKAFKGGSTVASDMEISISSGALKEYSITTTLTEPDNFAVTVQDNLPEDLYPGEEYKITMDYTFLDSDQLATFDKNDALLLLIDHPSKQLVVEYYLKDKHLIKSGSKCVPLDGDKGKNFIGVRRSVMEHLFECNDFIEEVKELSNGWRITWKFVLDAPWPEAKIVKFGGDIKFKGNLKVPTIAWDKNHTFTLNLKAEVGDVILNDMVIGAQAIWHAGLLWFFDDGKYYVREVINGSLIDLDVIEQNPFLPNFCAGDRSYMGKTTISTISNSDKSIENANRMKVIGAAQVIEDNGPYAYELEVTPGNKKLRCDEFVVEAHKHVVSDLGEWSPGMVSNPLDKGIFQPKDLFYEGVQSEARPPEVQLVELKIPTNRLYVQFDEPIGLSSTAASHYALHFKGGAEIRINRTEVVRADYITPLMFNYKGVRHDAIGCYIYPEGTNFEANVEYTLTVKKSVRDLGGNPLKEDYFQDFAEYVVGLNTIKAGTIPADFSISSRGKGKGFIVGIPSKASKSNMKLQLYSLSGRVLKTLDFSSLKPGYLHIHYNELPSLSQGYYIVRLNVKGEKYRESRIMKWIN